MRDKKREGRTNAAMEQINYHHHADHHQRRQVELRLQAYIYATWAAGLFPRKSSANANAKALPAPAATSPVEGEGEGKLVSV